MKLVNKFFREVKRLIDLEHTETRQKGVWPFGWSHESTPETCFKRPDGLWEGHKKLNTHLAHGGERVVFLWRVEPNYCTAGRPVYTADRFRQFLENSETEKILIAQDGYEFVWKWATVVPPTKICWGMKMGKCFFELRKDGNVLIQTPVKAEFLRKYKEVTNV